MITEQEIINIESLLNLNNLCIPCYQRPYKWSEKSVNTLFTDIIDALTKMNIEHINNYEYRLGSVILYDNKSENKLEIVDGQQRITTLIVLINALKTQKQDLKLPNFQYTSALSIPALKKNNKILNNLVSNLNDKEKKELYNFILKNCTVLKFTVSKQEEAFQLFDSQNSRGKDLDPHDLLKAYHLREMNDSVQNLKLETIRKWENDYKDDLKNSFNFILYPLINWYKGKNGLYFDKSKIDKFKGIKQNDRFNYARYHMCVYAYLEKLNSLSKNINNEEYKLFQLTQPILAGQKFFEFIFYYIDLSKKIDDKIKLYNENKIELLKNGQGDKYINYLLKDVLIFFADKFGTENIDESIYKKILSWCYFLRFSLQAVYQESINKYAIGQHDYNREINIFEKISEMTNPKEILAISTNTPTSIKENRKQDYNKIIEYCGWDING